MPCSSPKHAPLHFRSRLLRPLRLFSHSGSAGLRWKGKKEKKNRPESSNERKRTCSRIKSYFDPSVGSDWGSLMSICLAGISLAPGNPTGFLRIGEDSKVVRLELWRDTHSVAASTRVNTWWFCVCVSVCVGCVCEVQGSVSRCRQGQALGMGNGVHACTKCSRGGPGRRPARLRDTLIQQFLSEPKQSCFTHKDRQYTDNEHNGNRQAACGGFTSLGSAQDGPMVHTWLVIYG